NRLHRRNAIQHATASGSLDTGAVREEPQRIDGRLEATLRVPDVDPAAIVVIAHALPTHGGTMRTPIMAAIARACAARGWYALRFNFRGVGASDGEWSGGRHEVDDLAAAVGHARTFAQGLPLGLVGYSFGAFQVLAYPACTIASPMSAQATTVNASPPSAKKTRKRILTGDRPTGPLHVGNYVGTLANRVKLQDSYDTFLLVADHHMLTTRLDHLS